MRSIKPLRPQTKYNFEIVVADFVLSGFPAFSGLYVYDVKLAYSTHKFLYVPNSPLDMYILTKTGDILSLMYNSFMPTDLIKKLYIVKPIGLGAGTVHFQCYLTDFESVKILNHYDLRNITLVKNEDQEYILPFPTHNMKILLYIPSMPLTIKIRFVQYPFNSGQQLEFDLKAGISGAGTIINNVYEYNLITGSAQVTNPQYPFPSYETILYIKNEDLAADIADVDLRVVSYE